jgi:hypothetical protein
VIGRARRRHGGKSNAYRVLVGKQQGKRPLGRPRHMSEDAKIFLRETEWDRMEWNV